LRDTTGSIPTKYEERLNIIQDSGTLPTTLDALREAIRSEWVGARMVVDSNPPPPPNSGPNENITRLWQLESLAIAIDARINNSPCRGLNSETFTSLGAGGYNSVFQCPDPLCALKPTALLCSDPKILIRHAFDGVGPKTLTGSAFGSYAKNMGSKVIADMLSTPDVPSTLKVTVDVFPATDSEGKSYIGMELAPGEPISSTD
jgi:hypothetical protein